MRLAANPPGRPADLDQPGHKGRIGPRRLPGNRFLLLFLSQLLYYSPR